MKVNFWYILAIAMGGCIAFQPVTNAMAMKKVGLAPTLIVTNCMVLLFAAGLAIWSPQNSNWAAVPGLRPDLWMGGIYGIIILMGGILVFPKLGALTSLGLILFGQFFFGLWVDHFGLYSAPQHSISMRRIIGILVIACGVAIVSSSKKQESTPSIKQQESTGKTTTQ